MLQALGELFQKKIKELIREAYSQDFTAGWTLAMQNKITNKQEYTLSPRAVKELEEILKQKGL